MAFNIHFDNYAKVQQDDTGAPGTVYIGVTNYELAADADTEWALLRITVAGGITTYSWAGHDANSGPKQQYAWTTRAAQTY